MVNCRLGIAQLFHQPAELLFAAVRQCSEQLFKVLDDLGLLLSGLAKLLSLLELPA